MNTGVLKLNKRSAMSLLLAFSLFCAALIAPKDVQANGGGAGQLTGYQNFLEGDGFYVALDYEGHVWTWGDRNDKGQLGDGTNDPSNSPSRVQLPIGSFITDIAVGEAHVLALDDNGNLYAWGSNFTYQICPVTPITSESCYGPKQDEYDQPKFIMGGIKKIAAGLDFSIAIDSTNHVITWGEYYTGPLVDPQDSSQNSDNSFLTIAAEDFNQGSGNYISMENIVQITASSYAAYAVDQDGRLYVWGSNQNGELGIQSIENFFHYAIQLKVDNQPKPICPINKIYSSAFSLFAFAVSRIDVNANCGNNLLYGWGDNTSKQLGNNKPDDSLTIQVVYGAPFDEIIKIVTGKDYSAVLFPLGQLKGEGLIKGNSVDGLLTNISFSMIRKVSLFTQYTIFPADPSNYMYLRIMGM